MTSAVRCPLAFGPLAFDLRVQAFQADTFGMLKRLVTTSRVVCLGLLVAACGSGTSQADGVGFDSTTNSSAAEETASESQVDVVWQGSVMTELLATVPLKAHETILEDFSFGFDVYLVDLNAMSELAGAARPNMSDVEASELWLTEVFGGVSVSEGGTGLAFPNHMGRSFGLRSESEAEFGFSIFEADRYAQIGVARLAFTSIEGEGMSLAPTLLDLGGGVFSSGAGEDFEADFDDRSEIRLGQVPYRVASRDGEVAVSQSTPAIQEWLAGGPSLADVPDLAEAARGLDTAGSVSGLLTMGRLDWPAEYESVGADIEVGFSADIRALGIGVADVGGRPGSVAVYVFADESAAALVRPEIDAAWRTGTSLQGTPYSEMVDVSSIEQSGRSVVVVTTPVTGTTMLPFNLVSLADPIFRNA